MFQDFFIYGRHDRQFDLIEPNIDNDFCSLSEVAYKFLNNVISINGKEIFFSIMDLTHNMGDKEAYVNCLNLIRLQKYKKAVLNDISKLKLNDVYHLSI